MNIDVVIPTKNEGRHLPAVLDALAQQRDFGHRIHVYVVDTGSCDDTVTKALAKGATVIHSKGPLGLARNAGIKCGSAPLVAFLDGHSVPSTEWASAFLKVLENQGQSDFGGCLGAIDNVCESELAEVFARESIFSSEQSLQLKTISGLASPLPWMPTGNCIYLRNVLEAVGLFSEDIQFCEDTDLSWKVVLRGYQLRFVPNARVTHFDYTRPLAYIRKYLHYGAGAAELAYRYGFLGERTDAAAPRNLAHATLGRAYDRGYERQAKLIQQKQPCGQQSVRDFRKTMLLDSAVRSPFEWSPKELLALSSQYIYWFANDATTILLDLQTNTRVVLEDTSSFLFRCIISGCGREGAVQALHSDFDISALEAESEADDFVQQLIAEGIFARDRELTSNRWGKGLC